MTIADLHASGRIEGEEQITGTITHVSLWMLETFPALSKFG